MDVQLNSILQEDQEFFEECFQNLVWFLQERGIEKTKVTFTPFGYGELQYLKPNGKGQKFGVWYPDYGYVKDFKRKKERIFKEMKEIKESIIKTLT